MNKTKTKKISRILNKIISMTINLFLVFILINVSSIVQATAMELMYDDEKLGEVDADFSDNLVTVTLTKMATLQFLDYTAENFKEVNAISVEDLTSATVDWVRGRVQGGSDSREMNINIETYRRILSITLPENSKEKVLIAVEILNQREDIEDASPSYTQSISSLSTNDTYRNEQWGIDYARIDYAWNLSTGSSNVTIGVLDSGINSSHDDLTNQILRGTPHDESTTLHRDFTLIDFPDGLAIKIPVDRNGHGTHVAGIIGAQGNNEIGVAGVSWNVKLVDIRVFDWDGKGDLNWLIKGIEYAKTKPEINILNFSGGGDGIPALKTAISSFNGLFITAAGNSNSDNDSIPLYPASYDCDNLITVGSLDSNGQRSSFSNWGDTTVDLWAPGRNILSTFPSSKCTGEIHAQSGILLCENPSLVKGKWVRKHIHHTKGYHIMNGTSMAAPYVTGVAALMLSTNPNLTPQELRSKLIEFSDEITITVPDPNFWNQDRTRNTTVRALNAEMAVRSVAIFDTRVLSETEIEIRGTFGRQLSGSIDIPETLNGRSVTIIAENAFANCTSLTNVTLPSSLVTIKNSAFNGCSSLSSITIPSSVTTVGVNAFSGCSNLSIYIKGRTSVPSGWNNYWNPSNRPIYFNGIPHTHNSEGAEFTGNHYHGIKKVHYYEYRYYCTGCKYTVETKFVNVQCDGPPCPTLYSLPPFSEAYHSDGHSHQNELPNAFNNATDIYILPENEYLERLFLQ